MLKKKSCNHIELKIATVVAISAILHDSDLIKLEAALQEVTRDAADLFENEFTVIDVAALNKNQTDIEWVRLIKLLKKYHLNAVAVRNATSEMEASIAASGLSIDHVAAGYRSTVGLIQPPAVTSTAHNVDYDDTMIVDTPIRAGQRIYARGADLVITDIVNSGAEVIADGNIHIYAPLHGRALAGASGNTSARIFAIDMEPELVSINGVYRTFEDGLPLKYRKRPVQVRMDGDQLDISLLSWLRTSV
jgi:septum site-determining protein MinC